MLEALDHAWTYTLGEARPQLFRCRDVETSEEGFWSLKFMGRNDLELAADWIGALLAHSLGIRTPEVDIAEVGQAAIETAPGITTWATPGPAFASRQVEESDTIRSIPALLAVAQPAELGRLYSFDGWFDLIDRRRPDGVWNLLVALDTEAVWVIDYGKGLSSCWFPLLGTDTTPLPPPYPDDVLSVIRTADGIASCREACRMIAEMSEADLSQVVGSTPPQWLDPSRHAGVVRFLLDRSARLADLC